MTAAMLERTPIYTPRNDWVLVRIVTIDKNARGIVLPGISAQSKEFHVVEIGAAVENLKAGDKVVLSGLRDVTYFEIPADPELILVKQENVVVVVS